MISPTLKAGDKFEKKAITKAIIGKTIICEVNPINNGRGNKIISLKFLGVNDKPTPNIINARMVLSRTSIKEYED
jgi:hypothetical protein